MSDDLKASMFVSGSGMRAQGLRMRIIAENIANADSTASTPGGEPYRRKVVTFQNVLDDEVNANLVKVDRIDRDMSDFNLRYEPGHPAANEDGYVRYPNVTTLIESMDMREAGRSYEANLNMVRSTRDMIQRTIDLLR